jgi:transposase
MLGLPSSVRIYVATQPVDMRSGMDSLSAIVRRSGGNPFSGHLFVFLSRRRDRAKILTWERGGFVLWYRRLERGQFARLPRLLEAADAVELDAAQLAMLLDGVDFSRVQRGRRWEPRQAA